MSDGREFVMFVTRNYPISRIGRLDHMATTNDIYATLELMHPHFPLFFIITSCRKKQTVRIEPLCGLFDFFEEEYSIFKRRMRDIFYQVSPYVSLPMFSTKYVYSKFHHNLEGPLVHTKKSYIRGLVKILKVKFSFDVSHLISDFVLPAKMQTGSGESKKIRLR
jgi:hypothetical protein